MNGNVSPAGWKVLCELRTTSTTLSVLNHDPPLETNAFGSILKLLCKFSIRCVWVSVRGSPSTSAVVESKLRIIMFNAFGSIVRAPLGTLKKTTTTTTTGESKKKMYAKRSHTLSISRCEIPCFGIQHKALGTFGKQSQFSKIGSIPQNRQIRWRPTKNNNEAQ